jgi:hypothetical protein
MLIGVINKSMELIKDFEVDDNELESLRDKIVAPKALEIFYSALSDLSRVTKVKTVKKVFRKAEKELFGLYEFSASYETDFHRINGQLLRCLNQRAIELKCPHNSVELEEFSVLERGEFESMGNPELRVIAKTLYCQWKKKLNAAKDDRELLAEWDLAAVELASVYKASNAKDDWGKWIFMLDSYVKKIVDGGGPGVFVESIEKTPEIG